ncbi:M23 family metallopeptidase [Parabacteroides sp. Marseille-P3160]|uniref:M23 family metallopeptidase n=1 Tax=Parabacteroides sp. Marseille-P3160 TaxID=1917887 RepID=UPI0009BA0638|nr:M23 family metallopeptidase [Parabacteroides sp. Marseille-P3160]
MKLRKLLFLTCAVAMISATQAQVAPNKRVQHSTRKAAKAKTPIKKIEYNVSELMADRVGFKKEVVASDMTTIQEADYESLLKTESLMFPAEELYGSDWDNRFVDPFRNKNIHFPDSCTIDCSSFILPVLNEIKVTSVYGPRRRRMHRGIDLKVEVGDTIRVAFDGKIRIKNYERRGYGYYLVVRHPNGLETVYGHLSKFLVDENDIVRAGQPIALGGNTGRSTGSHLHFETRFLGQAINPAEIIDFENGVPHKDLYVFHNVKVNGRSSNIYTSSNQQLVYHRVKSGDTLGAIAQRYGTSVSHLCQLNGIKSTTRLRIGQSLRCGTHVVRDAGNQTPKEEIAKGNSKKEDKVTSEAGSDESMVSTTVEARSSAIADLSQDKASQSSDQPVYHRIKSGDTLDAIARKYGVSIRKICELNGITKSTILKIGRPLRCS